VKRKAQIIRYNGDKTRAIAVDVKNSAVILEYINRSLKNKKKFNYITELILSGLRIPDVYDKEELNSKCKGVTAMKLFKGGTNDRIYCKEITRDDKTFIVITAELFEKKKTQGVGKKNKQLIEKVGSYDYEIFED